ncbi:uncharacterized protein Tco025E_00440 [Trypanosoma conorhini]|uniref:Uncharacterized protein n=1 Tax=Trypanosoma conorhini TaxID=83891 RepID=A0A3R7PYM4_9TRYP|nr:uncharacterized protein Tco025E_00440 [Trypanosoma conorhini]RNF27249.1 hypothetical protein Tco025E_00440 [Trypanosoma conorhini]
MRRPEDQSAATSVLMERHVTRMPGYVLNRSTKYCTTLSHTLLLCSHSSTRSDSGYTLPGLCAMRTTSATHSGPATVCRCSPNTAASTSTTACSLCTFVRVNTETRSPSGKFSK